MSNTMSVARRPVQTPRQPSHASIAKSQPVQRPAESPQAPFGVPRAAGNRAMADAVAGQPRQAALGDRTIARIKADVEAIVATFRKQVVWESDEKEVLGKVRAWAQRDRLLGPAAGTPHLDRFLFETKIRAYSRNTGRSAFMDQSAILYEDLFVELEDDRLAEFIELASASRQYSGPGALSDQPENFWKTMGMKEAVGVWGILKGMGTSAAGMVDAGAWGVTRAMKAAGLDVADPVSAAQWLAEQYDISGDAMFGKKEWSEGEELFLGMSAAEFSTHGGELVWQLVMMGKGGGPKWAQTVERLLGTAGSLMTVETSAKNMLAILERLQQSGKLDVASVAQDPEFHQEAIRLVAGVFGAVTGGNQNAKRIGVLIEGAQIEPMVGKLIVIYTSDAAPADKTRQAGPILMEMVKQAVSVGGAAHTPKEAAAGPKQQDADQGDPVAKAKAIADQPVHPDLTEAVKAVPDAVKAAAKPAPAVPPTAGRSGKGKKPATGKTGAKKEPPAKRTTPAKATGSGVSATAVRGAVARPASPAKSKPGAKTKAKVEAKPAIRSAPPKAASSRKTMTDAGEPAAKRGVPKQKAQSSPDPTQTRLRAEVDTGLAPRVAAQTPDEVRLGARDPRYKARETGSKTIGKPTRSLEEARRLYDDVIAETSGKHEVGIWQKEDGSFAVRLGQATEVDAPSGWRAIQHYHTNAPDVPLWRMPARADVQETSLRAAGTGHPVTEFVEYPLPGGARGRAAYTVNPDQSVRIEFVDGAGKKVDLSFKSIDDYNAYHQSHKVFVDPDPKASHPEVYQSLMQEADRVLGKAVSPATTDLSARTMASAPSVRKSGKASVKPVTGNQAKTKAPVARKSRAQSGNPPAASKQSNPAKPTPHAKKKALASTTNQAAARKYLDGLRKKKPQSGTFGESWDHRRFPKGAGRRWRPGDPPDMPSTKGHPDWNTIRARVWKNLAHNELMARKAGAAARDTTSLLDLAPVKSLTDAQLRGVLKTGKTRKGFEIEHARIPQRVASMLIKAGFPVSEARRLGHVGDPTNLDPVPREWHAVVDAVAARWVDRNRSLPRSLDDRDVHPLGSMNDGEIKDLLDSVAKHKLDLGRTADGRRLRGFLQQENARRGNKWVVP